MTSMFGFDNVLTSETDVRSVYHRGASQRAIQKKIDHLDAHCVTFLEHATFVAIGTRAADGTADVSPKGGPPGFTVALDEHRLAIPDLAGNNLLDSFSNLVTDPGIGLIFMIPGVDETLRVNGRACITQDPQVLQALTERDPRVSPIAAIGVEVEEAFMHCAKAFRRGVMWQPQEWPDASAVPSLGCVLRDHAKLGDVDVTAIDALLEDTYAATMWQSGS
jgi:PPOX class probable FMN-dependent enzyme